MSKQLKNFLTLAGLIIIGSFLAFLYSCIDGLALFSARINPALELWVFWILFGTVGATLAWLVGATLMRPKPLLVYANPTEEEMVKFRKQLLARMKKNRVLRDEEVVINDETDLPVALAVLKDKADEEIRSTARRVFIGTSISQNGRLDVLVVLYLVSRMSWRVAKLYNQRPHYRELINLYANVAITSFVAGSIEDLGIEEHVTRVMAPLVSGSAIGAVPGAQAIAGTITNSVLTGSTNCLLALRCGILARDFMALNLDAKGSMRRNATVEASKIFVSMSGETVVYVTKALVKGTKSAMKSGSSKTAKAVSKTMTGTASAVGNGAKKVGRGTRKTVESVGKGVKGAAGSVSGAVTDSAKSVGKGVRDAADAVSGGAKSVGHGAKDVADAVSDGAKKVGHEVKVTARTVKREVSKSADAVLRAAGKVVDEVVGEVKSSSTHVKGKTSGAANAAVGKVDRILDKGKGKAKNILGKIKWPSRKKD
jgi:hypothetical protein